MRRMSAEQLINATILKHPQLHKKDLELAVMHLNKIGDYTSFVLSRTNDFTNRVEYKKIVERLLQNEPIQYILKEAFFYDDVYFVNRHVLIPRVETEELTRLLIEEIQNDPPLTVADIGTGSGVIAQSVSKHTDHQVYASDISKRALKVASLNNKNGKVILLHGDLLKPYIDNNIELHYIIANLPYIKEEEILLPNVINYEPKRALFLPQDNIFIRLFKQCKIVKKSMNGLTLFLEFGTNQGEEIAGYAREILGEGVNIKIVRDLTDRERFLIVRGIYEDEDDSGK